MQQELGFVVIGLSIFYLICICISLGIDYWLNLETDVVKEHSGLWKVCVELKESSSLTTCTDIDALTEFVDDYRAVRAMLFLGLFFVCGGVACVAVKMFVMKDKKEVLYAAAGIYALAGLFCLIGFAVYHANIFKDAKDINSDYQLHAGFAFCIIAWVVTWALAGLSAAMAFVD